MATSTPNSLSPVTPNVDALRSMLDSILDENTKLDSVTDEEIVEIKKNINPYGVILPAKKSWINLSITNMREEYMRKFITTSLIGFLYRSYNEFEVEPPAKLPTTAEEAKQYARAEIRRFIEREFKYDPDRHAKSAYKDNFDDPERAGKYDAMRDKMRIGRATQDQKPAEPQPINAQEQLGLAYNLARAASNFARKASSALSNCIDGAPLLNKAFMGAILADSDIVKMLSAKQVPFGSETLDMGAFLRAYVSDKNRIDCADMAEILRRQIHETDSLLTHVQVSQSGVRGAYEWVPSADAFFNLDRYITNNYEQLREATTILYREKADIEFAIQYYDHFESEAQAVEHCHKNESSVRVPIFTITNETWTLMGPFLANRDRVDFYNKETAIIKSMFEKIAEDQKIGHELLSKNVKAKVAKNVREAGPADPGLEKYRRNMSVVDSLGVKSMVSREEREELDRAHKEIREYEMAHVPEDAIQVDVFKTQDGKLVRDKFYTEASPPEEMELTPKKKAEPPKRSDKTEALPPKNSSKMGATPPKTEPKSPKKTPSKINSVAELAAKMPPKSAKK